MLTAGGPGGQEVSAMPPFAHIGPDWIDRPWWGMFGWLMPLLLVGIVAAVAVWAVARMTREHPTGAATMIPPFPGPGLLPPPAFGPGAALEQARMRYARGEIAREEFLQVSRDLGAAIEAEESAPDA
jgi:uncharacterized membrane protein